MKLIFAALILISTSAFAVRSTVDEINVGADQTDGIYYNFGWWGWAGGVVIGYPYTPFGYVYYPYYGHFGAIAYSQSTDRVGYSFGDNTQNSAESKALYSCGVEDCISVVWVQGGCAAVYTSTREQRLGWGYAATLSQARSAAVRGCRYGGKGGCVQKAWVCSD